MSLRVAHLFSFIDLEELEVPENLRSTIWTLVGESRAPLMVANRDPCRHHPRFLTVE